MTESDQAALNASLASSAHNMAVQLQAAARLYPQMLKDILGAVYDVKRVEAHAIAVSGRMHIMEQEATSAREFIQDIHGDFQKRLEAIEARQQELEHNTNLLAQLMREVLEEAKRIA